MFISPGAELRSQFIQSPSSRTDNSLEIYINQLKKNGLFVHKLLFPSIFTIKNGLQYPGIGTNGIIKANQILAKVPESLVLSSLKVVKQTNLFEVYNDQYYHNEYTWQDRVLMTYLLYLLSSKPLQNIWYLMLMNMSKDVDIICFWPQIQLQKFRDKTIKKKAQQDLQYFEQQWRQFQKCQLKYEVLKKPQFNKQNFRWIFIHKASRCFSLDYLTMVPFCQLFNHHISDVSFKIQNIKQQTLPEQSYQYETSNQSDNSYQCLSDGEFDYQSLETKNFNWNCRQCLKLVDQQKKSILTQINEIQNFIKNQINWQDQSILFIGHIIQKYQIIKTQFMAGRKKYPIAYKQLKNLKENIQLYRYQLFDLFKLIKSKKYKYQVANNNISPTQINPSSKQDLKYYQFPSPLQQFPHSYILKTGSKAYFQANNQVYFCYGRRSNRITLLHYGIAIQGNKYDHCWISIDIGHYIKDFPDLTQQIIDWGISRKRKFKIKHCDFNMQILLMLRLSLWTYYRDTIQDIFYVSNKIREIKVLQNLKQIYMQYLDYYDVNNDLNDKNISYHEYFIRVYHLQKIRILQKHLNLIQKIIQILHQINKGANPTETYNILNSAQRYMLRHYLKYIVR